MTAPQTHEWVFYEVMWRTWARKAPYPIPWWLQQTFRRWVDSYDGGLFNSKEAALSSNALYRYWNMIGVKDHVQESLVGQAGEIEPVYDAYAVSFFVFDPETREIFFPQNAAPGPNPVLEQRVHRNWLPVLDTIYRPVNGLEVTQRALATTTGLRQRDLVLSRLTVRNSGEEERKGWLCLAVLPTGPSGFQRHYLGSGAATDRRITYLSYLEEEQRFQINTHWGPVFSTAPQLVGVYGNRGSSDDPEEYLLDNPFQDLASGKALNGTHMGTDYVAGLCTAVVTWPFDLSPGERFETDIRLPVGDFRDVADLESLRQGTADELEQANEVFWTDKLTGSGLQPSLPPTVEHLSDLFRICRADLLILSDDGAIHPGPTIYDSFWIRDSSVEAVACALVGDTGLATTQLADHHTAAFNRGQGRIGPVAEYGFFGAEHEKQDYEWDSNGQALWAFGRFDRLQGAVSGFGQKTFAPYVIDGARWIRDNRDPNGLLHSGWSAEHLGERDKPHYWDDLWALAGLYEAARLAERLGAPQAAEIWNIFADVRKSTSDSIHWVLQEQQKRGLFETFIPTGPADVGRLDSTMIGAVAYFHPCRLYMGKKLGDEVDYAARMTLETIWADFVDGGFRHDAAWNAYGPYLTMQLAHAFLLIGDVRRMDECLAWSVDNAAYARTTLFDGSSEERQVVLGAWNEQHCVPIASGFANIPARWWYMGDIPHGWAAAEFLLLLRDILFFEADEDDDPHIYLAPGVMPHWLDHDQSLTVTDAPTVFGGTMGYRLHHDRQNRTITIDITQPPPANVRFVYPCRFGPVTQVQADGQTIQTTDANVPLPSGTRNAIIIYQ